MMTVGREFSRIPKDRASTSRLDAPPANVVLSDRPSENSNIFRTSHIFPETCPRGKSCFRRAVATCTSFSRGIESLKAELGIHGDLVSPPSILAPMIGPVHTGGSLQVFLICNLITAKRPSGSGCYFSTKGGASARNTGFIEGGLFPSLPRNSERDYAMTPRKRPLEHTSSVRRPILGEKSVKVPHNTYPTPERPH